jgi:hypothetical protein
MAEQDRPSGLVITDDRGNYYYLRAEILAEAKMPEEDVKKLTSGLAGGTGKGSVSVTSIKDLPQIVGTRSSDRELSLDEMKGVTGGLAARGGAMTSTIMCPW